LITTPSPIFAPNARNKHRFNPIGHGHAESKNTHFSKYHPAKKALDRPRSNPFSASN
jgi:hypothetical protein